MYFKRKAYDQLLEWKEKYADKYAVLLEGARRVGKSTALRNKFVFTRPSVQHLGLVENNPLFN